MIAQPVRIGRFAAAGIAVLLSSSPGWALTPLSKDLIDAIRKEWRSAPFHGQVEVLAVQNLLQHSPQPDTPRCGEITAVVRQTFKGNDRQPPGSELTFTHCINVFHFAYPDFKQAFRPGNLLEAFLADDPDRNGKMVPVGHGIKVIQKLSTQPQLNAVE